MPRRSLALVALALVACQKPEATPAAKAGPSPGDAPAPVDASAAGAGVAGTGRVTECPKSLGGTDKLHRVISRDCGAVPVTEDYYVDAGSLTLEAGASLSFKDGAGLYIGYYEPAQLIVQGTAEAPVVLTAAGDKAPGSWRGVSLNGHADRSAIEHLVIEYAGNDESALFVDAEEVSLKGLKLRESKGTGLLIGEAADPELARGLDELARSKPGVVGVGRVGFGSGVMASRRLQRCQQFLPARHGYDPPAGVAERGILLGG